jgi:hypothetical protein
MVEQHLDLVPDELSRDRGDVSGTRRVFHVDPDGVLNMVTAPTPWRSFDGLAWLPPHDPAL